ncbi:unnamed protein product [marine sediment metagenome]|uniref:Uncharacterized protein n=1 Tax=marine sediment metagenome TaxID=412755 RepID=X1PCP4_9ZZZZ
MQWLIDMAIEAMEAWFADYGGYHDRGPSVGNDFTEADLTQDGNWNELDLSAIVPAGAKAVNLHSTAIDPNIGKAIYMRPAGDTTIIGTCTLRNQVANVSIGFYVPMSLSTGRKIEYKSAAPGYAGVTMKIRGWWF